MSNDGIILLDVSETLSAEELVAEVVREAERENGLASVCLTSSFQTEDMVVLHMLREHLPRVPVIFLETGYHFPELITYRDQMVREWGLNLVNALPKTTLEEHEREFGLLHIVEPTKCCAIRKVEPLMRSLEPYSWWFTGLRREQSPTRAGLKKVEDHRLPTGKSL
ncbi:MAG: phosphoadenosine phosphosulfate reductase family protein, partial [Acidobacteriaceae bacterium]